MFGVIRKKIYEFIKVIGLVYLPCIMRYIYSISFYFLKDIVNFVNNLKLENWAKTLFLEVSIFIFFIVFIFLNMIVLEFIIKVFYKKSSIKLIKDMLFVLSIRINLLKNELKKYTKLSDLYAYVYIVSFIISIVITVSFLYNVFFDEPLKNGIIDIVKSIQNKLIATEILMFTTGLTIFLIFYYVLLIGRIVYLFMIDKKSLLMYVLTNLILMFCFKNIKLLIIYCSSLTIALYFPFSNEKYLKLFYNLFDVLFLNI